MTHNRLYNHCLIFALILFLGLGLALVLPWIANSQSQAAQSDVGAQGSFMNLYVHGKGFKASPAENTQLATDSEHVPEAITRYYVAKTGDGTNPTLGWNTAFTNVQDALVVAVETSEIWIAEGVYYPDEGSGQINNAGTSTFFMTDGVALYGGFDTSDSDIIDRDWENNVTVLSGDIDGNDDTDANGVVSDTVYINGYNAYHVVTADGTTGTPVTGNTMLDGLTITAGRADNGSSSGGGFYCDGSGSGNECSPSLTNVNFSGNLASMGGAMFNDGSDSGTSNPILTNVTFSGNSADAWGGAMCNDGYIGGTSSPSLTNVTFSDNRADSGGAMYNIGWDNGTSSPSLSDVTFSGNSACTWGGAMVNNGYLGGTSSPSLINVFFLGNSVIEGDGGAMVNAAIESGISSPSLINVTFSGNSANTFGGAMVNGGSNGTSNPSLLNVTFSGNSAGIWGGAMFNGGEESGTSNPSLTNVTFTGNSARVFGGAMFNYGIQGTNIPSLTNVTFSGNSAGDAGGAMYNDGTDGQSNPVVRNSILWNNKDSSGTGTISSTIYNNNATIILAYSLVQGAGGSSNWTSDPSFVNIGGNIDIDPMFVTPIDPSTAPTTTGNLRLQTGSPAIDAGDNTFVAGVTVDLDGQPRIIDGNLDGTPTVDMGAYETLIDHPYDNYLPLIFR
jgi:predicted outer membrane repeat protein